MKPKQERVPDENRVLDDLVLQNEKTDEQVADVAKDDQKVVVGIERLHHVDLVSQWSFC